MPTAAPKVPHKKPSFGQMIADLGQFAKDPAARTKVAAIGDGLSQDRKETGISAPANEAAVNDLTRLSGGEETSKRNSDVNPQGVASGTALPDQPSLKHEELERNEKPFTGGASVESPGKNASASNESASAVLERFKAELKLAESGESGQEGRESGSPVAAAILDGAKAPQVNAPAVSAGAQQSLESAAVANGANTSPEAKKALGKSAGTTATATDIDLDVVAQKVAAWQQHGDYGYQVAKTLFAPVADLLKQAAAYDPVALVRELKVAEYVPIVLDRATLEPMVRECQTQLKTAGKNDAEIDAFLKEAGEADRRAIDFENAVRLDERQKVAAELELEAAVLTKVALYRAAGLNDQQIYAALQKDADADAAAMAGAAGAGDPTGGAGGGMPPGADPTGGAGGGGAPGGIDPAELAQLEQLIQHIMAQTGLPEEGVLQMLEQAASGQGGQGGGAPADPSAGGAGAMPPGADPTAGGAGGAPDPEGGDSAPAPKKEKKEDGDDEPADDKDDKKEAARRLTPELEALFPQIDALTRTGKFKPGAAAKVAQLLLAQAK